MSAHREDVPPLKLFDDAAAYRRPQIKAKLGGLSDRALDALLRELPRIALSKRTILYPGRALNELVAEGLERGGSRSAPSGAAAREGAAAP